MRFVDAFSGIGGFRKGLTANGHVCVFSCEIDNNARRSYSALYGLDVKKAERSNLNQYLNEIKRNGLILDTDDG